MNTFSNALQVFICIKWIKEIHANKQNLSGVSVVAMGLP